MVSDPDSRPDRQEPRKTNPSVSLARFAGMGIQLAVSIGLGVLAGLRVDEHLELNQPLGTAALALFGLAVGMVQILRALKS